MKGNVNTPAGMEMAIAWTRAHLARINEGGIWYVPRVCSTYTVSHKYKTLIRRGLMPDAAINKVMAAIGWRVIE
jgi:hypothetical protein